MARLDFRAKKQRYRVRFTLGPNGSRTEPSRLFKTRRDAKLFVDAIAPVESASKIRSAHPNEVTRWVNLGFLTQAQASRYFDDVYVDTVTDYDALDTAFDKHLSLHPRSYRSSKVRAKQAFRWHRAEVSNLRELEADDVAAYLTGLNVGGLSRKTVYHANSVLRQIFDVAVKHRMMKHNVARDVRWTAPRAAENPRRPVSDLERNVLLDLVERPELGGLLGGNMELAMWLGKDCGLRNREAETLMWTNCDFQKKLVVIPKERTLPDGTVQHTKTPRKVPMTNELRERLLVAKAQSDHDFVLGGQVNDNGVCKPWREQAIQKAFRKVVASSKELGDSVTFYCFRHRFCRLLLTPKDDGGAGMDIDRVMKIMGHANITTTQLYLADLKSDRTDDMEEMSF